MALSSVGSMSCFGKPIGGASPFGGPSAGNSNTFGGGGSLHHNHKQKILTKCNAWCSGAMPTQVLCHKLSRGGRPSCKLCGRNFDVPKPGAPGTLQNDGRPYPIHQQQFQNYFGSPFGNQQQNQNIQNIQVQGTKTNNKQNGQQNSQMQQMQMQLTQHNEQMQMLTNTLNNTKLTYPPPQKVQNQTKMTLMMQWWPRNLSRHSKTMECLIMRSPLLTARANAKIETDDKQQDIHEIGRKPNSAKSHLEKRNFEVNKMREWYQNEVVKAAIVTKEVEDLEKQMEKALATQGFSKTVQISETLVPPYG